MNLSSHLGALRALLVSVGFASLSALAVGAESPNFLNFPRSGDVSAASEAPAFAWRVEQAGTFRLMFAQAPTFTPRELFTKDESDGQPISGVELSPDARFIAYRTGEPLWGEKAYNPASLIVPAELTLWVINTDAGSKPRRLGPGTGMKFAPSGAKLLYKHGDDLSIVDPNASPDNPVKIANGGKFGAVEWAPDARSLAFTQTRGGFAFIGHYVFGADRIEWLVTGPDRLSAPHWSPDGKRIAYLRWAGIEHTRAYDLGASEPFTLEIVDVATQQTHALWQAPGPAMFPYPDDPDTSIRWIDNDRLTFYSEHDGWGRLYGIAAKGGTPTPITPPNCEVSESESAPGGRVLVVHNCPDLNTRHLSSFDSRTGERRDIKNDDIVLSHLTAGTDRYAAFTGASADSASMLRVLDLRDNRIAFSEKPSAYGYTPSFTTPAPEVVRIEAEDGGISYAQLFLPKTPGKHPAIVWYHGGPYQQSFPAHQGYFYAMNREMAARGYVVLSLNYRGSEGYGLKTREHPQRAWRGAAEVRDAAAAGRWLAARSDVDSNRIGAWGGSYGGLMTLQSVARHSEIFKVGVALYPLVDWSFSSPNSGWWDPSRNFGVSDETRKLAFDSSPVAMLDRWTSPVLLIAGDIDTAVDVAHTVDLTQKLRARRTEVKTLIVPNESHGFVLHSTQIRLWNEMSAFFDGHLKGQH